MNSSPWNEYLATEIMNTNIDQKSREALTWKQLIAE